MTVLVTGAGGFAGSHLVEHLAGHCELVGWTRSEPPAEIAGLARWTHVDLLDRERVREAIAGLRPAAVYHCAGASHLGDSWRNTAGPLASNVLATHYLLDAIRRAGAPCRVLVTGSASIYAASPSPLHEDSAVHPESPYALSKLAQEELGRRAIVEDGIDVILTRPFNHTGPRQRPTFVASGMARQIALIEQGSIQPVVQVGNLDAARDLTDVRDTVRAYALLMQRGVTGMPYNVASGTARPMRAILDGLIARARVPVEVTLDPGRLRPHDAPMLVGDPTRLRTATGWTPLIGFDRLLDDLLDYWRAAVRQ